MLASYTWSHAIDNVDPDVPGQNPNDPNFTGRVENGNAIFDQRHRFVLSGVWMAPGQINFGGIATLATGLPYNYVTGANNSGDGATADRPVINGVVVGRNTGRGTPIYEVSPFLERPFASAGDRVQHRAAGRGVQRLQPRELRRVQRHLRQRRGAGPGLRHAADRHHQPVAGAVAAVLAKGRHFNFAAGCV